MIRPYSGGPAIPRTSAGVFASIVSATRSRTSAFMSSSNGGPTTSGFMPTACAARESVASSSGAAARGSHDAASIVVVNAAPDTPITQSYSALVATATQPGSVHSRPSPKRSGGMSFSVRLRGTRRSVSGTAALGAVRVAGERVLEQREHLERHPLRRIDARGHPIGVRCSSRPATARILSREQPRDRGLRARIVDLARGIDRPQHEEDIGLVEERERQLAPQVARLARRRVTAELELVGEQELDAPPQRPLDITRARRLGERRQAPDETRVAPGARIVAVDRARGVVLPRLAHQTLHQGLDPRVSTVSGHRYVAHDVADKTRDAVIALEHPAHAGPVRLGEVLENSARRATDSGIVRVSAVFDEQQVRPMRSLVLRSIHVRSGP